MVSTNKNFPADYMALPNNLPMPLDDGAANHLLGLTLPRIKMTNTAMKKVDLSKLAGVTIIFCYPMTGVPGVSLPGGWDEIPGARGCTPQACAYRDNYEKLMEKAVTVFGISTQDSAYQLELKNRINLQYELLTDFNLEFQKALNLPVFEVNNIILLKRLTLIIKDSIIKKVHYPVFPSNKDVDWVLQQLL